MKATPPILRSVQCLLLALGLGAVLVAAAPANAAAFTVTNLEDSGTGSLRQAILDLEGVVFSDISTNPLVP